MDSYRTILKPAEGIYKEKGSKFIAYASPVTNLGECEEFMDSIKKIHPKARHHCYAYRIGTNDDAWRASDDGEPSGSAGKPIYNQLLSLDLRDIMVIVVRYFGGTKLGIPGLINAYKISTQDAIDAENIIVQEILDKYVISFDYSAMPNVMNTMKSLRINELSKTLLERGSITFGFPPSESQSALLNFTAMLNAVSPESIDEPILKDDHYEISEIE